MFFGTNSYFYTLMQIQVLKSKIHRATVTQADLNYIGSVTIDQKLMEAANLIARVDDSRFHALMDFEEAKKFKPVIIFPSDKNKL